uniref:PRKCA-binding protein n=1 Tax=Schistocephalus solidus TaxID=70667 RepID=A0A0X3P4P2_SCHSO
MSVYDSYMYEEDKMGMTVTSGSVTLKKDPQNLVGISIGGGAPYCPCLYVVQVFDSTPAARDGTIQAGDEITGVGGISVKGKGKVEVAHLIQSFKETVTIFFNKLHADPKQGKTLDIVLKKMKHRMVENMEASTADALGLSRAILVNDGLVKKMDELDRTASMFAGLVTHSRSLVRAIFNLSKVHHDFGQILSEIGVKEPQMRAGLAFTQFADAHRDMEKFAIETLKKLRPMVADLNTFLTKAIPDTKLTVKRYLDVKFEYLSYCLKVKEMDDEEYTFNALQEPLYRVETGNYEYRLVLRCRQDARVRFAKLRNDVLVKLELLDNKHVQDTVLQLQRFVTALANYHENCYEVMKSAVIFPLEMDLSRDAFAYRSDVLSTGDYEEEDEDGHGADTEDYDEAILNSESRSTTDVNALTGDVEQLLDLSDPVLLSTDASAAAASFSLFDDGMMSKQSAGTSASALDSSAPGSGDLISID